MEIGFNDDVEYNSVTFHIQTEDHGVNDPRVSTQLFTGGRVLDNQVVNYGHLIEGLSSEEERKAKIRKVMVAAHRNVFKRLLSGEFDETMGFARAPSESVDVGEVDDEVENFVPSQSRVPETAQVVEEDGQVTFTFETGEAIDLNSLRQQLNEVDLFPEDTGVALFDDLADEMDEAPMRATVASAPVTGPRGGEGAQVVYVAAPGAPALPDFGKTGKRAFRGLLEPPPSTDVVELVMAALNA